MSAQQGTLLVISGPSGAGKGTLCSMLLEVCQNVRFSVSATTRKPRPGEIDGVHYDFIDDARFDEMVANEEFLEYACVFGMNRYGTPKKSVETMLEQGMDVLLDIDVQGALNVKRMMPEAVMVFITPPSLDVLAHRLRGRGTETPEAIERRLETARQELGIIEQYDYLVINDNIHTALEQLRSILVAERCRTQRNRTTAMKNWEETT